MILFGQSMLNLKSKITEWLKVIPLAILWVLILYSGYSAITTDSLFLLGHYLALFFLIITTFFFLKRRTVGNILLLITLVLATINILQFMPHISSFISYSSYNIQLGRTEFSSYSESLGLGLNLKMFLLFILFIILNLRPILSWFKK